MSQETSAEEVKAYFSQFGKVEEAVMLMDQQTKRHRGFGFVTFEVDISYLFSSDKLYVFLSNYCTFNISKEKNSIPLI